MIFLNRRISNKNKTNKTKKLNIYIIISIPLILIIIIFLILLFLYNINNSYPHSSQVDIYNIKSTKYDVNINKRSLKPISFSITAIGDIMCHDTQYKDAYNNNTGVYDFNYVFNDIKHYTSRSDLTIGNLETTFGGKDKGYRNYPTFNTPDSLANAISNIGVDVLSTASNHSLDTGYDGLVRTSNLLNDLGIKHVGTAKNKEERDNILFVNVKGVNIAIISYTYGTNGIPVPKGKEYSVNLIDEDLILKDINTAKTKSADMIIACMHWGNEYQLYASDSQKELADLLFENGVNIIIGNHSHVIQPMEKKTITTKDGITQDCFVIYALGNFISDQNSPNTRNSIILDLNLTKLHNGKITINNVDYTPIYMYKSKSSSKQKIKLLNIEEEIKKYNNKENNIDYLTFNLITNELNHINKILGKH